MLLSLRGRTENASGVALENNRHLPREGGPIRDPVAATGTGEVEDVEADSNRRARIPGFDRPRPGLADARRQGADRAMASFLKKEISWVGGFFLEMRWAESLSSPLHRMLHPQRNRRRFLFQLVSTASNGSVPPLVHPGAARAAPGWAVREVGPQGFAGPGKESDRRPSTEDAP